MRPTTRWSPSTTNWHAWMAWSPRRPSTDLKMSLAGSSRCKNTPLQARSKIWTPPQSYPRAKVQARHWKRDVDPHHTCRPRRILHGSTCSWKCSCTMRAVCDRAQDTDEELQWLPWHQRSRKGPNSVCSRQWCLGSAKKTVHRLLQLDGTLDDWPSTPVNCDQDDNSTEARVQGHWVQQPLGPNHKHHCILHSAWPVLGVTRQSRHCNKWCWEDNCGRSANVAEWNVQGRSDGCVGEQASCTADMGQAPDILHQEMAGMQAILCHNG